MIRHRTSCLLAAFALAWPAHAADVTNPAEVERLLATKTASDVQLDWEDVTTDAAGQPETVDVYKIYRGTDPDFVPDKETGTNQIGTSPTSDFTDAGAAADGVTYYYRVSAVDTAGNEAATRASRVTAPPVLSGFWTDTTIELEWTDAQPVSEVVGYRVYYGKASGVYEFVDDVGLVNSWSLSGLEQNVNWYAAVTAVDAAGNESAFSNEHVDAVGGVIDVRAMDEVKLCWGAGNCPPVGDEIQRSSGQQKLIPFDFPEGDWTNVTVTYTLDSRLCGPPIAPDKCGDQNPGWNPCGDPWDRTAHLFVVLDETCIDDGGSCVRHENVELMRAITPFGTDAPPPDGSGDVPPRVLTLDITPLVPLLKGRKYLGADISTFVRFWWVSVDFHFSERPEEASPKRPADGIVPVFFGGATPPQKTVDIPPDATQVITRLFTTGHGGNAACDGGSNNGGSCDLGCPGGSCQNCDEFCHRLNRIVVDGASAWEDVPWRDDCSPGIFGCTEWNACGFPSCTFSRAGWCPGYIACHHDAPCDQDLDLTPSFSPGQHTIDYEIPVRNGSWSVSLLLYWYR